MPGRNAAPLLRASAAAGSAAVKRAVAARPGLPRRLRSPTDPAFAAAAAALAPARLHALSAARDGLREQDRGRRAGARGRRGRPAAAAAAAAAAEEGAALARLARPRPAGRRQHPRVPAGAARGGAAHLLRGHHGAHPQHGLPGPQGPAVDAAGVRGHGRYRLFFFLISIVICFVVTKSLLVTCCLPIFLMGMRYYFSRKVILSYLECALNTDMSDIEQYYMKSPGSCFWVALLNGNVVGIVAARGNEEDNTLELRRMSVDSKYRGKGIAKALGRKVLEFAVVNNYSSVVLGTTAVKVAAHKLYESLGFKHVGVVEHYTLPGMTHSLLERAFFQLRYHRYCLQLREE